MRFCLQCGYDLSGQRAEPGADLICPECSSPWDPELARTVQCWQGWRRSVFAALRLPAIAWGVFVAGAVLASCGSMLPTIAVAFAVIPFIIGLMIGVASAVELTDLPPGRRPHAGVFALVVVAASTLLGFFVLAVCGLFLIAVMR